MHARKETIEFDENCKAATNVDEIKQLFFKEMESCGIRYVALASHTDPVKPPPGAVMFCNYPLAYQQWFSDNECAKYDPAFWYARRANETFHWSDLPRELDLTQKQVRVLNEARDFGIADGMTIPLIVPGAMPASCSLVPGPGGFEPLITPDLYWIANRAHLEACRRLPEWKGNVRLTNEQRDVMYWVIRGKSDGDIGAIMNISARTIGKRVDKVRELYGVRDRAQAGMLAVTFGEIQPEILFHSKEMKTRSKRDSK